MNYHLPHISFFNSLNYSSYVLYVTRQLYYTFGNLHEMSTFMRAYSSFSSIGYGERHALVTMLHVFIVALHSYTLYPTQMSN